jgi:protein gp37
MIFVNSMSHLFHDVPEDYVKAVWRVMEKANCHTYQVLTKRSSRSWDMLRIGSGSPPATTPIVVALVPNCSHSAP